MGPQPQPVSELAKLLTASPQLIRGADQDLVEYQVSGAGEGERDDLGNLLGLDRGPVVALLHGLAGGPHRIAENFDVLDFELDAEDLSAIDALVTGVRGGPEPDAITLETFGRDIPEA